MSLPKLTAFIGESVPGEMGGEFALLVKDIKKVKDDEEAFMVYFVIDLPKKTIYFELGDKLAEESVYTYNYFGNNASAGTQYYLTREVLGLKYLLKSTFSDLYMLLEKNDLSDGELGLLLKHIGDKGFIKLEGKKGKGALELDRLLPTGNDVNNVSLNDKNDICVGKTKYNPENLIRLFIGDENKKNRFVLVVPKIITEKGKEIILSTHPDYLDLVRIENQLGASKTSKKKGKICYICKAKKADVSSKYSTKFSRSGINKTFTSTTINTAPYFLKKNYDNVYSVCSDCYKNLRLGEKHVDKHFRTRIAGENVFLLPEGLLQDFDYEYLNVLKNDIDLAFKNTDAEEWLVNIDAEKILGRVGDYVVNFIFYRTDGNSVTVLETIEDVPVLRFHRIMKMLCAFAKALKPRTGIISLGSVYRLIPVKTNKRGEQQDIGRVLSFYKAILSGEQVSRKIVFNYAVEGLEKGLKQLNKSMIDNYHNLGLTGYIGGYEDFFIRRLVYGYIVLFKACQELGVLDGDIFKRNGGEGKFMDQKDKTEVYLEKHGFDDESRMLFYLGIMVNMVAAAQVRKGHTKKPILRKIQFQGMSKKEIKVLYNDVQEKLIQYDLLEGKEKGPIFRFSEYVMRKFHHYYGLSKSNWDLSDQANVFMLMAGYAYNVPVSKADENTEGKDE